MNLLIPIDSNENLCTLSERSSWALAIIDGGETKEISFYENKKDIQEFIDYMIVQNQKEKLDDFLIEGIGVLLAPMQRSIEDIIEAYMFRELHQISS